MRRFSDMTAMREVADGVQAVLGAGGAATQQAAVFVVRTCPTAAPRLHLCWARHFASTRCMYRAAFGQSCALLPTTICHLIGYAMWQGRQQCRCPDALRGWRSCNPQRASDAPPS
jgi:hypothetical protein